MAAHRLWLVAALALAAAASWMWMSRACTKVRHHVLSGALPGPSVLIVAGTHGNEPAGTNALLRLLRTVRLAKGRLVVVPRVNPCGLALGIRANPGDWLADVNRNYPDGGRINRQIQQLVRTADWIVDLHEGWGYRRVNRDSVGSGVYPGATAEAQRMAAEMTATVNATITDLDKRFVAETLPPLRGSFRDYVNAHYRDKHYVLIETTGQQDVQPMRVRVDQHLRLVGHLLARLGLVR